MGMRSSVIVGLTAASMWMASPASAQETPDAPDAPDVAQCRKALDDCVIAAQTPADIEVCSAQEARCIAGEMQVTVPEAVPADRLIQCTYSAAECALTALNADSLSGCSWALDQCITAALNAQFSCLDSYTQCVFNNPLLLPICSLELLVCTD
jgi:hypothetical protein